MDREEQIKLEIEQHLEIIKQLRIDLEKEEQELQVCYNVLNLIEEDKHLTDN